MSCFSPQGTFCIQIKTLALPLILLSPPPYTCRSSVLAISLIIPGCSGFPDLACVDWNALVPHGHPMFSPDRWSSIHLKDATVSASLRPFHGPFPPLFFAFLFDSQQASITTAVVLEYLSVGTCPSEVEASGRQVLLPLGTWVCAQSVVC